MSALLDACEEKPRSETLSCIYGLLPTVTRLGGPDTPEGLFHVVDEIVTTWP
ncbi:hypothetical protein ACIRPU_11175 [Streptomyces sp. NPDC102259]|uniref:hypothetical protein n=1 Tax=Streptomyces sp. NPDC102259 TaxID=3366148 RepID=UPI00382BEAB9